MANSSPVGCPSQMAVARDADGREMITVRSARVSWWTLALQIAVGIIVAIFVLGRPRSDPRVEIFAYVMVAAWLGQGAWIARTLLRELRGWDRVTFGADAMTLAQRGAWRTRRRRVQYDDIVDLQVELQPQPMMPRWMPERRPVALRIEPQTYGVVLQRNSGRPLYVADRFGHSIDAASWLAEQIRRGVRTARRAHG